MPDFFSTDPIILGDKGETDKILRLKFFFVSVGILSGRKIWVSQSWKGAATVSVPPTQYSPGHNRKNLYPIKINYSGISWCATSEYGVEVV